MKRILTLLLTALLLSGCMSAVRLNDRAIVQAIGVDLLEGGGYRVTMQICEAGGEKDSPGQCVVVEETGGSMTDIFTKAAVTQGKQMFLGNCKLLLLGFETAQEGANYVLNFFNASHRINPSMQVALAKGTAGEVLKAKEENPKLTADTILDMLTGAYQSGFAPRGQLMDLMGAIHGGHTAGALAMLEVTGQGKETGLAIPRAGLFDGDRLATIIDLDAVRGCAWTQNTIRTTPVSVQDDWLGRVAAVANAQKARVGSELVGDLMVFNIELTVRSTALETVLNSGDRLTDEDKDYAVSLQERLIQGEIEHMIEATEKQGYDLMGLSLLTRQRHPDFYEAHREDWARTLMDSGYSVNVTCEINRTGVDGKGM